MSRKKCIGSALGVVLLIASVVLLWGMPNETTASADSEAQPVSIFARRSDLPGESASRRKPRTGRTAPSAERSPPLADLCRVRGSDQTVFVPFFGKDHKITLMPQEEYASFPIAQNVVELINTSELVFQNNGIPLPKRVTRADKPPMAPGGNPVGQDSS